MSDKSPSTVSEATETATASTIVPPRLIRSISSKQDELECSLHYLPKPLMREFSHVFNDSYLRFQDNDTDMDVDGRNSDLRLLAIPTNQKAREDLVAVGDHIEAEKDRLLNVVSLVLCVPSFLLLVDASYPAPSFWQMKIQSKVHGIRQTHLSNTSVQGLLG